MSDYDCAFGGVLVSPPPSDGGHSAAWTAAVVSSTVGSVALLVSVLIIAFTCIQLRRRNAQPLSKSPAGASDGPGEPGRLQGPHNMMVQVYNVCVSGTQ